MFVLALPLQANGAAGESHSDQGRISTHVIGAVVAVAAGTAYTRYPDGVFGQAGHVAYRSPQVVYPLGMRPDMETILVVHRNGAGRTDGAVHNIRLGVHGVMGVAGNAMLDGFSLTSEIFCPGIHCG